MYLFFGKHSKEIFDTKKGFLNCQWWQKQNKLIHIYINQPVFHKREFVLITAAVEGNIPRASSHVTGWTEVRWEMVITSLVSVLPTCINTAQYTDALQRTVCLLWISNSYGWGSFRLQTITHLIKQLICLGCQSLIDGLLGSRSFFPFFLFN